MKRYRIFADSVSYGTREDPYGNYVCYADVAALVEAARVAVDALETTCDGHIDERPHDQEAQRAARAALALLRAALGADDAARARNSVE